METKLNIPFFDGHNDTLLSVYLPSRSEGRHFFEESTKGHIDYPRAMRANMKGGFFAMFTTPQNGLEPTIDDVVQQTNEGYEMELAPPIDPQYARMLTVALMAKLFRLEIESGGKLKVVRTITDLKESFFQEGVLSAIMHIEGAEAIDAEFNNLHVLYQAGLRSIGPVWSRPNIFGNGVPFAFPASPDIGGGLTFKGRELIKECNELGILIDLSHLNLKGFKDVARISTAPLVATHSNVHAICPFTRNLLDEQLQLIKESNGIVGINFYVGMLRADGKNDQATPIKDIVRHFQYVADKIGVEHLGLGSDFDGALISNEINDVQGVPKLLQGLYKAGFSKEEITAIAYKNWFRVIENTWK